MLKYDVKLVILNYPVCLLKLYGVVVEDKSIKPVESYKVNDFLEQQLEQASELVGVNTENGVYSDYTK